MPSTLFDLTLSILALDVGSGSGYLTVCMAEMVGAEGRAVGVEHIPELVELAKKNTQKDHPQFLQEDRVAFYAADGRVGFPQDAPYDCMYITTSFASFDMTAPKYLSVISLQSHTDQHRSCDDNIVMWERRRTSCMTNW